MHFLLTYSIEYAIINISIRKGGKNGMDKEKIKKWLITLKFFLELITLLIAVVSKAISIIKTFM